MIYKPWQREDDRTTGDSQRCYLDTRKPFHLEYLPVLEPQLCICASFLWVLFNCWFFSLNLLPFLQLSAFPFRSSSFSCPSLIPSYQAIFLSLQWSAAPSETSRFTTPPPTLWTFAGKLPQVQSSSTGWSTLLWTVPGLQNQWVSNCCVGMADT